MTIKEILQKVQNVNSDTDYWFIRTEYGALFDNFIEGKYIAIGWDFITQEDLRTTDLEKVKLKIAKHENIDLSKPKGKSKATGTLNKLLKFSKLKKNDIVLIPSRNSDRIAFGRILDDSVYDEVTARNYIKRRKVKWLEVREMDDLNPIFYQVKSNQHTISLVNNFSTYIDREIGNLFQKGENTHYVLNVEKQDDINFNDLTTLMQNIEDLLEIINNSFNFNEDLSEIFVKINLQSKGSLELIKKGQSLAVLAYILFATSCESPVTKIDDSVEQIMHENEELIESTKKSMDSLQLNIEELTKPFEDGQ